MAQKTPADAILNWQARMAQAGGAWQAGCAKPGIDWAGPATQPAAMQKMANNFAAACANGAGGRWLQSVQAAGTAYWRQQTQLPAMAQRFQSGAAKGLSKYTKFCNAAAPIWGQMKQASQQVAAQGWEAQVVAAISVMYKAGKRGGGNVFAR
jgi:hypothetical protein